jgi:LacI family transcriptional regulator
VVNNAVGRNIRVSPETRQRVLDAVARLGYVANPAARSLAGGLNRILGIFTYEPIFPFQNHDFFYPFLLGIEEEAEAQGYHLLLFTNVTNSNGRRSIYHDDTNLLLNAGGSILLGLNENKEELKRLQQEGYPFTYIGRREVPGVQISYTAGDYASATAELTRQLADLGHRRLLFIGNPPRFESSIDRENGFIQTSREYGLSLDDHSIVRVPASELTPEFARRILENGFTGALVDMDTQCQALLAALRVLGLSVPQDFSIAMLGDPHYIWDNSPDWSMFTIPRREMGVEAVRLLVHRLEHPDDEIAPRTVSLPCRIVPGQTIAPPPNPPTAMKGGC